MKYGDNFRFSSTAFSRFLTTIRENKSGSNQKSLITGTNAMHWLEARWGLLLTQKWQFSLEFIRRFKLSENNFPGMLLGVVLTFVLVRHALYPLKNTRVWRTYFQNISLDFIFWHSYFCTYTRFNSGCHHMQCTQCDSHFCWDCLQVGPNPNNTSKRKVQTGVAP